MLKGVGLRDVISRRMTSVDYVLGSKMSIERSTSVQGGHTMTILYSCITSTGRFRRNSLFFDHVTRLRTANDPEQAPEDLFCRRLRGRRASWYGNAPRRRHDFGLHLKRRSLSRPHDVVDWSEMSSYVRYFGRKDSHSLAWARREKDMNRHIDSITRIDEPVSPCLTHARPSGQSLRSRTSGFTNPFLLSRTHQSLTS